MSAVSIRIKAGEMEVQNSGAKKLGTVRKKCLVRLIQVFVIVFWLAMFI